MRYLVERTLKVPRRDSIRFFRRETRRWRSLSDRRNAHRSSSIEHDKTDGKPFGIDVDLLAIGLDRCSRAHSCSEKGRASLAENKK